MDPGLLLLLVVDVWWYVGRVVPCGSCAGMFLLVLAIVASLADALLVGSAAAWLGEAQVSSVVLQAALWLLNACSL